MYKSIIIEAIQNQKMIEISWQKETTGDYSTATIAPYDIFPKTKKDSYVERDMLLGVEYEDSSYHKHPASIYLDTINRVDVSEEDFDGFEVKRILNPKNRPNIFRNW